MSSKFSGISKVQKPPPVCKKPPQPELVPPPPFDERWYQGYAEWFDPEGSDDMQVSGNVDMEPNLVTSSWQGRTPGKPYYLEVDMTYHSAFGAFDYTVTLMLNGTPVDAYQELLLLPQSTDPFDSGLVIMTHVTGQTRVHCRIMT